MHAAEAYTKGTLRTEQQQHTSSLVYSNCTHTHQIILSIYKEHLHIVNQALHPQHTYTHTFEMLCAAGFLMLRRCVCLCVDIERPKLAQSNNQQQRQH